MVADPEVRVRLDRVAGELDRAGPSRRGSEATAPPRRRRRHAGQGRGARAPRRGARPRRRARDRARSAGSLRWTARSIGRSRGGGYGCAGRIRQSDRAPRARARVRDVSGDPAPAGATQADAAGAGPSRRHPPDRTDALGACAGDRSVRPGSRPGRRRSASDWPASRSRSSTPARSSAPPRPRRRWRSTTGSPCSRSRA